MSSGGEAKSHGLRVLVCGGRNFDDRDAVWRELDTLNVAVIIHGGASGADSLADAWAWEHDVETMVFRPAWSIYGAAAGPLRNQRMLGEGKPDIVVAFKGGAGTADMTRRARAAGIPTKEIV